MGDRFKKVQAGEPLNIPAEAWNAFVDVAQSHATSQFDRSQLPEQLLRRSGIVKVRNQSGFVLPRFGIVEVVAPIIAPEANEDEFQNQITFDCFGPITSDHSRIAVLLEPLRPGTIGQAAIAGVTIIRIAVTGPIYECATPTAGNVQFARMVPHGPLRILWLQSGGLLRWAIVRFDTSNYEEIVYVTSNKPDEDGFYPGIVQQYDTATMSWSGRYPCKVLDANR